MDSCAESIFGTLMPTSDIQEGPVKETMSRAFRHVSIRARGPKERNVEPYVTTKKEFRKLCDYRIYRLTIPSPEEALRRQERLPKTLSIMRSVIRFEFDGKDLIRIIQFLTNFVLQCLNYRITENEAHVGIPYFLTDDAEIQYGAAYVQTIHHEKGAHNWPTAVDWLLRTFATNEAIRSAVWDFQSVKQRWNEEPQWRTSETSYRSAVG